MNVTTDAPTLSSRWRTFVQSILAEQYSFKFRDLEFYTVYMDVRDGVPISTTITCPNVIAVNRIIYLLRNNVTGTVTCGEHVWSVREEKLCVDCPEILPDCVDVALNFFSITPLRPLCKWIETGGYIGMHRLAESEVVTTPEVNRIDATPTNNSVTLAVNITNPTLNVYRTSIRCGVYAAGRAPLSAYDVQFKRYSFVPTNDLTRIVTVNIDHLEGYTTYDAYCVGVDDMGETGTLTELLRSKTTFTTACCRTITDVRWPSYVYNTQTIYSALTSEDLSLYAFGYELASAPAFDLTVTPQAITSTGAIIPTVTFSPAQQTFTSASSLRTLRGSFLLRTSITGTYDVVLTLSGTNRNDYQSPTFSAVVITPTTVPPAPKLKSAIFSDNGLFLKIKFDSPTDYGASILPNSAKGEFLCSLLFTFQGAGVSLCYWEDRTSIAARLNAAPDDVTPLLTLNSTVSLKANVVKAYCLPSTTCGGFSSVSSVSAIRSKTYEVPTVIVTGPTLLSSCDSMKIDASLSSGNGGRPWAMIDWTVTSLDGSDTTAIKAMLSTSSLTTPFVIPPTMLHPTTYYITLVLRNFMNLNGRSRTLAVVVDHTRNLPNVYLDRHIEIAVQAKNPLMVTAFGAPPGCTPSETLTYDWKISKDYEVSNMVSASPDPRKFTLPSGALTPKNVYQVVVTVTSSSQKNAFGIVYVTANEGALVAKIADGDVRLVGISTTNVMDASSSYDEDNRGAGATGLEFQWTCRVISHENYGSDCTSTISSNQRTASIVTLAANVLLGNYAYQYTVTIRSTANPLKSPAQAVVVLKTSTDARLLSSTRISFGDLPVAQVNNLEGKIYSTNSLIAEWTLVGDTIDFDMSAQSVALAPTRRFLDASQVTNGLLFNYGAKNGYFRGGYTYTMRLSLSQLSTPNIVSYSQITFTLNSPPAGGTMTISPSGGVPFSTVFQLQALYWTDVASELPLKYEYKYRRSSRESLLHIQSFSASPVASTTLPAGLSFENYEVIVYVNVADVLGSTATLSKKVAVSAIRRLSENVSDAHRLLSAGDLKETLDEYLALYNFDAVFGTIQQTALSFGDIDCSGAPDCDALNRFPCSVTSHTCDVCYPGFSGIEGHSNFACSIVNADECTVDTDCEFGHCVDNICTVPDMACPASNDGSVCSGHGFCNFYDTNGNHIEHCLVTDDHCYATCDCVAGYGGNNCGLDYEVAVERTAYRAVLCESLADALEYQDLTASTLELGINSLFAIYNPYESTDSSVATSCSEVLGFLSNVMDASIMLSASEGTDESFANLLALFMRSANHVRPISVGVRALAVNKPDVTSMRNSIHAVTQGYVAALLNRLIPGGYAVNIVTDSLRLRVQHDSLYDLRGAVLQAPPSKNAKSSEQYAALPASGFDSCAYFNGYAKVAVLEWGTNPFTLGDNSVNSNMLHVTTIPTASTAREVTEDGLYIIRMQLLNPVNTNISEPIISLYDPISFGLNPSSCNISYFEGLNLTMECTDWSALCPDVVGLRRDRKLQTAIASNAMFVSSVHTEEVTPQSLSSDFRTTPAAMSFLVVFVVIAIVGLLFLRQWDAVDARVLLYQRQMEKDNSINLTSVFDVRGIGLPEAEWLYDMPESAASALKEANSSGYSLRSGYSFRKQLSSSTFGGSARTYSRHNSGSTGFNSSFVSVHGITSPFDLDREFEEFEAIDETISDAGDQTARKRGRDELGKAKPLSLGRDNIIFPERAPVSSMLAKVSSWEKFKFSLCRFHRWVRVFTYPSLAISRTIRFCTVCNDLIIIIFVSCLFYGLFYPDDKECEKHDNAIDCTREDSQFESNKSMCEWNTDTCSLRPPPTTVQFIASVCIAIIILSIVPRMVLQFIIEKYCNSSSSRTNVNNKTFRSLESGREESLEDPATIERRRTLSPYYITDNMTPTEEVLHIIRASREFLQHNMSRLPMPWKHPMSAFYISQLTTIMNTLGINIDGSKRDISVMQKFTKGSYTYQFLQAVTHSRDKSEVIEKQTAPKGQFQNVALLQHFVLEQFSPIKQFIIKLHFFEYDQCSPAQVSSLVWGISWLFVWLCWIAMMVYSFQWAVNTGFKPVSHWGFILLSTVVLDVVINECLQIYILHVILVGKLKSQLENIYFTLFRLLQRYRRNFRAGLGIHLVQHTSPAIRASRTSTLFPLVGSDLLAMVDDVHAANAKQYSNTPIGYLCNLLLLPVYAGFNNFFVQRLLLDFTIPAFICLFLIANYYLLKHSVLAMWVIYPAAVFLFFVYCVYPYCVKKTEPQYRGSENSTIVRWSKMKRLLGNGWHRKLPGDNPSNIWRNMNLASFNQAQTIPDETVKISLTAEKKVIVAQAAQHKRQPQDSFYVYDTHKRRQPIPPAGRDNADLQRSHDNTRTEPIVAIPAFQPSSTARAQVSTEHILQKDLSFLTAEVDVIVSRASKMFRLVALQNSLEDDASINSLTAVPASQLTLLVNWLLNSYQPYGVPLDADELQAIVDAYLEHVEEYPGQYPNHCMIEQQFCAWLRHTTQNIEIYGVEEALSRSDASQVLSVVPESQLGAIHELERSEISPPQSRHSGDDIRIVVDRPKRPTRRHRNNGYSVDDDQFNTWFDTLTSWGSTLFREAFATATPTMTSATSLDMAGTEKNSHKSVGFYTHDDETVTERSTASEGYHTRSGSPLSSEDDADSDDEKQDIRVTRRSLSAPVEDFSPPRKKPGLFRALSNSFARFLGKRDPDVSLQSEEPPNVVQKHASQEFEFDPWWKNESSSHAEEQPKVDLSIDVRDDEDAEEREDDNEEEYPAVDAIRTARTSVDRMELSASSGSNFSHEVMSPKSNQATGFARPRDVHDDDASVASTISDLTQSTMYSDRGSLRSAGTSSQRVSSSNFSGVKIIRSVVASSVTSDKSRSALDIKPLASSDRAVIGRSTSRSSESNSHNAPGSLSSYHQPKLQSDVASENRSSKVSSRAAQKMDAHNRSASTMSSMQYSADSDKRRKQPAAHSSSFQSLESLQYSPRIILKSDSESRGSASSVRTPSHTPAIPVMGIAVESEVHEKHPISPGRGQFPLPHPETSTRASASTPSGTHEVSSSSIHTNSHHSSTPSHLTTSNSSPTPEVSNVLAIGSDRSTSQAVEDDCWSESSRAEEHDDISIARTELSESVVSHVVVARDDDENSLSGNKQERTQSRLFVL